MTHRSRVTAGRDLSPSVAELRRRGRLILGQAALPTDALLAREQMEVLEAWFDRRWPCYLHPVERVELRVAWDVIDELARGVARPPAGETGRPS